MKIKLLLFAFLVVGLSSCIKDEPPYREADIVDMIVEDDAFLTRGITENSVQMVITRQADYTKIVPIITLSPGATVTPASGVVQDFSKGKIVKYRVTAEDGVHFKDYLVSVVEKISLKHGFEEWTTGKTPSDKEYPILVDKLWANANSGIASFPKYTTVFPTGPTNDCVSGQYAAKLETMEGPGKILNFNIPIASGSLFRGSFSLSITNPRKSLRLGTPHPEEYGIPSVFKGFFKYTPGTVFTDPDGNEVPGKIDSFSMYAAIFKVTKGAAADKENLDGESINTSDKVIGRAEWIANDSSITTIEAVNGFTEFSIPFVYTEDINFSENDYRLTIVCASSSEGDFYMGSIGSTLIVDDLEILCDPVK